MPRPPYYTPLPTQSILVQFQGLTCDSYPNGSTTILTCLLASRIHLETEIVFNKTRNQVAVMGGSVSLKAMTTVWA